MATNYWRKREKNYYMAVDGEREVHLRESTKQGLTWACIIYCRGGGLIKPHKNVEMSLREGLALTNATKYRSNGTVVDVVPVVKITEQEYRARKAGTWKEAA